MITNQKAIVLVE